MLRSAGAGTLAGFALALFETVRASRAGGLGSWDDQVAVMAASVAVLLPAGTGLGLGWGLVVAALGDHGSPAKRLALLARTAARARVSTLLGILAGAAVAVAAAFLAHRGLLAGSHSGEQLGFLTGLRSVCVALPLALVGFPVAGIANELLGPLDRTAGARVALAAVVVAILGTSAGVVAGAYGEVLDAIDWRLPVGIGIGLAAFGASLTLVHGFAELSRLPSIASFSVLAGALCAYGITALSGSAAARAAVLDSGGVLVRGLYVAQRPFDKDGDGHAGILGGVDCDDSSADIYPGADEVPGNGIDEDCSGSDLALAPLPIQVSLPLAPAPDAKPRRDVRHGGPIILILVDTLRYQNLGAYGYGRPTSPNIDELAGESIVFTRAYSPSSKTPTSIPSILTGRYPSELARTYNHFHRYKPSNRFISEMLQDSGYRTGAVASHWYFRRRFGLRQGFDEYEVVDRPGDAMEQVATSKSVTDRSLAMLERLEARGGERFFLFVHYLDPHKWYINHEGFEPFGRRAMDRYDGEIRFTDHHLGRLLDRMRARPWWPRATVAFVSDHGEAFGEHGERFHGWSLYEHEIRVPFLLRLPGAKPGAVGTPTGLIDLVPTLLDVAGATSDEELAGVSLVPALLNGREWPARPIYAEMPPGPYNPVVRSLIDHGGRHKLIHRRRGNVYQVFDLHEDPAEAHNLASEDPALLTQLQERLQRFRAGSVRERPPLEAAE